MFKDHFSGHAAGYSRYRPSYPPALFHWLSERAPGHGCAWDAATGNGQAAIGLATHFDLVVATDASSNQIRQARQHARIRYEVASSEDCPLDDGSVDLVTVAQALHWFDLPAFYEEVRRVCRPEALFAALSYGLFRVAPDVDAIVRQLYDVTLRRDWPPERAHVEECYRGLLFPFEELPAPGFEMRERWNLDQLTGYLRTWSAVVRHTRRTGADPVTDMRAALAGVWGPPAASRLIRWPLHIRVGLVSA